MTPKPNDKSKRLAVRLPAATHKNYKKLCTDLDTSMEARLLSHIERDLQKNKCVVSTAAN